MRFENSAQEAGLPERPPFEDPQPEPSQIADQAIKPERPSSISRNSSNNTASPPSPYQKPNQTVRPSSLSREASNKLAHPPRPAQQSNQLRRLNSSLIRQVLKRIPPAPQSPAPPIPSPESSIFKATASATLMWAAPRTAADQLELLDMFRISLRQFLRKIPIQYRPTLGELDKPATSPAAKVERNSKFLQQLLGVLRGLAERNRNRAAAAVSRGAAEKLFAAAERNLIEIDKLRARLAKLDRQWRDQEG